MPLAPDCCDPCSRGVQLSYAEVKSLLLSSTDPCPAESAGATQTGGRLNVGSAMAALALLLHERGDGQLPGGFLDDSSAAEQLQQKILQNGWGQGLLQGAAPRGATPEPSVLPQRGMLASSFQGGEDAQAQGRPATVRASSADAADTAAAPAQAQVGRLGRRRQLRAGGFLLW